LRDVFPDSGRQSGCRHCEPPRCSELNRVRRAARVLDLPH